VTSSSPPQAHRPAGDDPVLDVRLTGSLALCNGTT
jgi:hypothetical protein